MATDAAGELRLLEQGQRLAQLRRVTAAGEATPHCGAALWHAALEGGARAAGRPVGRIAPGFRADLVVLDPDHPSLFARGGDHVLDSYLFAPGCAVRDVMVGGNWSPACWAPRGGGCHHSRLPTRGRAPSGLARQALPSAGGASHELEGRAAGSERAPPDHCAAAGCRLYTRLPPAAPPSAPVSPSTALAPPRVLPLPAPWPPQVSCQTVESQGYGRTQPSECGKSHNLTMSAQ